MKRKLFVISLLLILCMTTVAFADEDVPVLSEIYSGISIKLHLLEDDNARTYAYAGPGKSYVGQYGYKPYKQRQVTAYFIDNGWVYTDIIYATVEHRCLYFTKGSFEKSSERESLPDATNMLSYSGRAIADVLPAWGPGSEYNRVDDFICRQGTEVKVFFQENGFAYAEYQCTRGLIRMWLPCDQLQMDNATLNVTGESNAPYNVSTFGKGASIVAKENRVASPSYFIITPSDGLHCSDHPDAVIHEYDQTDWSIDTAQHSYRQHMWYECAVCGRILEESNYQSTPSEHFFVGDVCMDCKYVKGGAKTYQGERFEDVNEALEPNGTIHCPEHPKATVYSVSSLSYNYLNGEKHFKQNDIWYECSDCGYRFLEHGGQEEEYHTFKNGECTLCHYQQQ